MESIENDYKNITDVARKYVQWIRIINVNVDNRIELKK